ncbi:ras-related protein Rab-1B, putative [Hepatocystis sp. ex Piliocolobus tephrosceles]|nr:ras-related protein Rab-1B, putative [Hepatocystis sp. ex Piliocolobus tephrosceles]
MLNRLLKLHRYASEDVQKILIGNKIDLKNDRSVSYEEGKELADSCNIQFLETSAKIAHNVEQAFKTMAFEIKNKSQLENKQKGRANINLNAKPIKEKNKSKCC